MDEKLEGKLHEAQSRASHLADEVRHKGRELLEKVETGARDFKTQHIDDIAGDVGDFVKKHPGTLILASFVVGVAIGAVLRGNGRRDD